MSKFNSQAFLAFFTAKRRKRIYAIAVVLGGLFVAHGLISAEDLGAILQILGLGIGVIGVPTMALGNTHEDPQAAQYEQYE